MHKISCHFLFLFQLLHRAHMLNKFSKFYTVSLVSSFTYTRSNANMAQS